METLNRDEPKFIHITSLDVQSNGQWKLSCLCGKEFPLYDTNKLAKAVENRHKIIVGEIILDDE